MAERPRLGIDWGKARIGVAACNTDTTFAYPVETVRVNGGELSRLAAIASEYEAAVVYVGLPLTLSGERSFAAKFVLERTSLLAERLPGVPIRLVDERMSTAGASRNLGGAGRNSRQQRRVIDQAAAVEILQRALDLETSSGQLAGVPLQQEDS
ncbi:MAG: Holliday junction resolvase RuvX [Propionibacteriaceae bacterium]|nr:Holliday junction resolvase RuvX [Propionibacteriaceae bacterium]